MTRQEWVDLADSLHTIKLTLERAQVLIDTMIDDYFGKYVSGKDNTAINHDFDRQGAFAFLLYDQLIAIASELPSAEWVDGLKCEEASK